MPARAQAARQHAGGCDDEGDDVKHAERQHDGGAGRQRRMNLKTAVEAMCDASIAAYFALQAS